ncbi:methyltransferase domain-containing protein [Fredinandcohnia sp. QZ13]|uniref:class I SAM-dependent methyltransferase n=1 Tax=Fredinandcohnia sp. QZ13 TaxID=3073144 RepID=UPI0028534F69|nr:methyltransferase domain-containing protein [Fredinandcohnia sp. QZ13]MDR4886242.1 methyltransferase domain-containing protein [Fredinandcohnia sp. QZ13]
MGTLFPTLYDFFMKPLEKRKFISIRRKLLNRATGHVLELGSGTGINFPLYHDVHHVTAIEPNPQMTNRAHENKEHAIVPIEIVQTGAEKLTFEDNTYDTVVATLVFCTIPEPEMALQEMKRVCKPNGTILMFEHVKMQNPFLSKLQDWLTPVWKKVCDGCCLNRETENLVKRSGLKIIGKEEFYNGLFITLQIRNIKEES